MLAWRGRSAPVKGRATSPLFTTLAPSAEGSWLITGLEGATPHRYASPAIPSFTIRSWRLGCECIRVLLPDKPSERVVVYQCFGYHNVYVHQCFG